jgi:hypothetical protein
MMQQKPQPWWFNEMHLQLWLFDQVKGFPPAPILLIVSHCTAHTVIVVIVYEIHVGNYMDIH